MYQITKNDAHFDFKKRKKDAQFKRISTAEWNLQSNQGIIYLSMVEITT